MFTRRRAMFLGFFLVLSGSPRLAADSARVLAEWAFDREGDLEHRAPNGQLVDVKVTGGVLHCRATGSDPILELTRSSICRRRPGKRSRSGSVPTATAPRSSSGAIPAWESTEASVRPRRPGFGLSATASWRTYRLFPFWQAERKIVRLRFDVFDGAAFDIEDLRIVEFPMSAATPTASFDFAGSDQGWQAMNGAVLTTGPRGAIVTTCRASRFSWPPPERHAPRSRATSPCGCR